MISVLLKRKKLQLFTKDNEFSMHDIYSQLKFVILFLFQIQNKNGCSKDLTSHLYDSSFDI